MGTQAKQYRTDEGSSDAVQRRSDQICEMKHKLRKLYKTSGFDSIHRLYDALINYDQSLFFSESSLVQTLNITDNPQYESAFNMYAAITMCRYFNKDISALLAPPKAGTLDLPDVDPISAEGKYAILEDEHYFGDFYGYMFSRNKAAKRITPFTLTIQKQEGRITASLSYQNPRKPIILYGVPKLITRTSNIYIIFSNQDGEFFELFFHYQKYRVDKMWYRRGIVVADEASTEAPIIENFVLFDKALSQEKMKYLPGLLMVSGPRFCVSRSKVDALSGTPEMAAFLERYGFLLEHDRDEMYIIDENVLLSCIGSESSEEQHRSICQLLLLREQAEVAYQISYPADSVYPGFAHDFLVK